MNPFECYETYMALKLHFTGSYDYFKYGGKTRVSTKSFNSRKDKYFFQKISKKFPKKKDFVEYVVANLVANNMWIGEMSNEVYMKWIADRQSGQYLFSQDVETILLQLDEKKLSFNALFACQENSFPVLLDLYKWSEISLHTMVILDKILNYIEQFDRDIQETLIWPLIKTKIVNVAPFLDIDVKSYKKILKDKVLEAYK